MAKLWGRKNEFSDDTYTQRSPNLKECIERKIKYHRNETWEIIYYSSTSPPVLSIYNSAPRLVVKAPGTGRWYVWMRTKVVRFTACTVTWAHGLWTARAVFCSPASMSGSQENGQRYGLGGSGTAFRQWWPRGDRLMRARMWETHTHLLVLSLRTGSPQTSPSAFLGWSPICKLGEVHEMVSKLPSTLKSCDSLWCPVIIIRKEFLEDGYRCLKKVKYKKIS